ncbi:B12-binding domain-containing radical SAM protein [Alkaliphilus serpentinus]|uniref:B12-binding domain-containing radical SAM protein n=1 Tax=Alkaliphilus serpentinus TaxID=1482731 RepID=A0A833MAB0_9FIRM|nr:radical SAM protein [Alkaliphilus serpentinus]KAB3530514.1 B12-binding domain-containing radical SAM protein [Alkaliphilus serpentinus]
MKLTFILPAIGKKLGEKYIGTWKMEPLTIAVLKSLTPSDIETVFYDDRVELIDYDDPTDLVVITVETYTARRSYEISKAFRERGAKVILGGYHTTLMPEEAMEHADAIMMGNAEDVWQGMLADFQRNQLKKSYTGQVSFSPLLPDKSIFQGKSYLPVSLVETGRGCFNQCNFCAIAGYYNCQYYARPHEHIIRDIQQSKHKYHFLVDDNLVANKKNALEIFEKITPLGIKWAGQGTLSMAKDEALLKAMKKSGCEIILIGFESLEEENLRQMNKPVNLIMEERDQLVKRIHNAGIGIYATFVFGYDYDTEDTIEKALRFSEKHKFYTAAFNHLLPFPGTSHYQYLKDEKRLLVDKWWLQEDYNYGELAFKPKNMSPERLSKLCRDARKDFANGKNLLRRGFASMARTSPLLWFLFWTMNLSIGGEIDEKMNVPIGRNLDELPK